MLSALIRLLETFRKYFKSLHSIIGNNFLKNAGYTEDNMKDLLKLDMRCRRIWGVTLKQSDLKYNKTFDLK